MKRICPTKRHIFLALGLFFLALALIGVVLPLIPTMPFAIPAAFFLSRSSEKMYQRLISIPKLGPSIKDWNEHKVIARNNKIFATLMMLVVIVYLYFMLPLDLPYKIAIDAVLLVVIAYVVTRREYPRSID